jgi:hypothetical protein
MTDNKPLLIALVVVGALVIGYLAYYFTSSEEPAPVVSQPVEIPQPAPEPEPLEPEPEPEPEPIPVAPEPEPEPEPAPAEPAFVLPRLDDSDQLVRDGVVSLTRHEGINAWLGSSELIRKFVVFVDNVANGNIPRQQVAFLTPERPFTARQLSDEEFSMDESSYDRFNLVTDIFVSVDSRRAVEFYDLLKPLFQRAYDELGYPNRSFDDVVFKALGRMLETPVVSGEIRLVRPVVSYEFADPRLESLSAAQKQLIRMGPRNTRAVQAKLSEVALELRAILNE